MEQSVLIEMIEFLSEEMRQLTLWAGINEKRYNRITKHLKQYNEEEVQSLYDWLMNVRNKEYHEFINIYKMITPETWENYKILGVKDLQEQVLMGEAKRRLFNIWMKSYYPNRKFRSINNGQKEDHKQEDNANCIDGGSI